MFGGGREVCQSGLRVGEMALLGVLRAVKMLVLGEDWGGGLLGVLGLGAWRRPKRLIVPFYGSLSVQIV
jgi:hypothetical protein